MTWPYLVVLGALVVADVLLILELRAARKEMRAIRGTVPAWVGAAIAINVLIAAAKSGARNGDDL